MMRVRAPILVALVAAAGAALHTSPHPSAAGASTPGFQRRLPMPGPAEPPARRLRGEDGLVRVYDVILDGRFDQVEAELRRARGEAPAEACDVLEATAIWWRILLDPDSRALDAEFSAAAERAIASTEAWTERDPDNAEAWFYLGGAYAARVQWRVLRDEKLAAARDGKRIKQALEQALALDPGLDDAYFGIGLYRYYADVAPTAAKILRFLLLLPGGDREGGLQQMLRARNRGRLLQGEADYQLHIIYLWYEQQSGRALELLRGLQKHYPGNPLFLAQIADIQDAYQHDITASLSTWQTLLAMAREQRVNGSALAEARARLGAARQLDALHQTDHAIEQLRGILALDAEVPYAARALALLRLGEAHDRLGNRAAALASYRDAVAAAPTPDRYEIRERARDALRQKPDAARAEAYRLSLEGWRQLEQDNPVRAAAALERSLELNGRDPVTHYRIGRASQAKRDDEAALAHYELAISHARECPPPILAAAHLERARVLERTGRLDEALASYGIASNLFGAAQETRDAAVRALSRLAK